MRRRNGQTEAWNRARAQDELAQWQASGLTMVAFSKKRGYPSHRLSWWKRRLRKSAERTAVRPAEQPVDTIVEARVAGLGGGASVVVDAGWGIRIGVMDTARVSPSWVAMMAAELSQRG